MHVSTSAVEGFIGVENQLFRETDDHAGGKDDPEGFGLYDGVAKCARSRVDWIVVRRVCDYVEAATFAAQCVLSETDTAVG